MGLMIPRANGEGCSIWAQTKTTIALPNHAAGIDCWFVIKHAKAIEVFSRECARFKVHSIFCDHLNALGENQLPADSHSAWKLHTSACMHTSIPVRQLIVTCHSSGHKNFAGWRSLENLYG